MPSELAGVSRPSGTRPNPDAIASTAPPGVVQTSADVHVQPVVNTIQAALLDQGRFAGDDEATAAAIAHLTEALGPALRIAAIELAEQAAGEVRAQRPDCSVDVILLDGDPTLRVTDAPTAAGDRAADEEFDARITLRLPPTLKASIEDAAGISGESVNAWVVEALGQNARRNRGGNRKFDQSFDL